MRRASLVFSLVLIVAIAVGYVARRSELAGDRDLALSTAAELGASQLDSLIDVVATTALAGTDPDDAVVALDAAGDPLEACVVDAEAIACIGDGAARDDAVDLQLAWSSGEAVVSPNASVDVYDAAIVIEATGPHVSVIARAPVAFATGNDEIELWAATDVPDDAPIDSFAVEGGLRQTAVRAAGGADLFVVASGPDGVSLANDELTFYVIIFTLAVVLLVLASATILAEQRNLLERASFDPLTGLPNRGEFERRGADALAAAGRNGTHACLLLFDLNGFKLVNDTYGHAVGDELLQTVADRLRKAVRERDIVARWGGDEFVVAMPGIASAEMGARRSRELADEISGRTRLEGVSDPLRVKVSVGIALWPDHGQDLEALIEAADRAMYQAKREGLVCRVATSSPDDLDVTALGLDDVRSPR